jgi:hypothetical protein
MVLEQYRAMIIAPDDALAQAKRILVVADADQPQILDSISLFFERMASLANLSIAIVTYRATGTSSCLPWMVVKPTTHRMILKATAQ